MSDRFNLADNNTPRILVVGGGAAGLSCAWRLAGEGCAVTLLDRGPVESSALWASGGMLAAGFEASVELDPRHPLAGAFAAALHEAADQWSDWADQLQRHSPTPLGYERRGVLSPLLTDLDEARAETVVVQAARFGVTAARTPAHEARRLEPSLNAARGAILFPGDGQLDNRALARALRRAFEAAGGRFEGGAEVAGFRRARGRVTGVQLADGRTIDADLVLAAPGAALLGREREMPPMRPVKGQMLAFDLSPAPGPDHVIRGFDIYLAAKPGGRLIVGATVEPGVDDLKTDDEALQGLHRRASAVLPDLAALSPVEAWAGLRPASGDAMPVIGVAAPGLIIAGGGFRNGVLLAPLVAEMVCALVFNRPLSHMMSAFSPQRDGL